MWIYSALFIAGGLGAVTRYAMLIFLTRTNGFANFSVGVLTVNSVGSFAMGLVAAFLMEKNSFSVTWQTAIMAGFLGGFTTFSAFSLEFVNLWQNGDFKDVLLYTLLGVSLPCLFCFFGFFAGRWLGAI